MAYYRKRIVHGQHNLHHYSSSRSTDFSGFAPAREREKQMRRCRIMAILMLLALSAGIVAVFI